MDSGISEQTCSSTEQRAKASIVIARLQEREELRKAEADEAKQLERYVPPPIQYSKMAVTAEGKVTELFCHCARTAETPQKC